MELVGTTKQLQVAGLLAQGLQNKEIGAELGMRPRTVKAHVHKLAYKNGISGKRIAVLLIAKMTTDSAPMPKILKPKQQRICQLVTEGKTNGQIAQLLGNTEHVIKNYMRDIFDVTGVWNRNELTRWYRVRLNLLDNYGAGVDNYCYDSGYHRGAEDH